MNVRYERDVSHQFMIPEIGDEFREDDYQVHMLTENQIPGLLGCKTKHINGISYYYYDITAGQSIMQVYETERMRAGEIRQILRGLHDMLHELDKYLLDEECIVLDPECIYLNIQTQKTEFCYLPSKRQEIMSSFQLLAEYMLHHIDQDDAEAVRLGFDLYRGSCEGSYNLETLLKKGFEPGIQKMSQEKILKQDSPIEKKESYPKPEAGSNQEEVYEKEPVTETETAQGSSKKKQLKKEKKQKEKHGNKEKSGIRETSVVRKMIITISIAALLLIVTVILVCFHVLTVTQGGGLAFLIAGIFGYFISEQWKQREVEKLHKSMHENGMIHKQGIGKREEDGKCEEESMSSETSFLSLKEEKGGQESSEGKTVVLWKGEEEYVPRLSLIRMNSRDRESILLVSDRYLIGKQKSKVDIYVNDPAVSRIHAELTKEGEDYYLRDRNSTNGTYINGKKLKPNEKMKLQLTDEVMFAQTGYYVGKC